MIASRPTLCRVEAQEEINRLRGVDPDVLSHYLLEPFILPSALHEKAKTLDYFDPDDAYNLVALAALVYEDNHKDDHSHNGFDRISESSHHSSDVRIRFTRCQTIQNTFATILLTTLLGVSLYGID